jgi:hypothetical protein
MRLLRTKVTRLYSSLTYKPTPLIYDLDENVYVRWFPKESVRVTYEVN